MDQEGLDQKLWWALRVRRTHQPFDILYRTDREGIVDTFSFPMMSYIEINCSIVPTQQTVGVSTGHPPPNEESASTSGEDGVLKSLLS